MTILIQGMRRSGTTILYDALLEDPALHCFYEPLREDTETPGGGSGARASDPFAETRALRLAYRDAHFPELEIERFNWGGPGEPAREIGPGLPQHCTGFISHLLDQAGTEGAQPMVKFTRIYAKLEAIAPLAPEGVLVHVVRDPRSVAASMMMGKGRKRADDYRKPDAFFDERSKRKLWSSRELSEELLELPSYAQLQRPANFERILMVWKYTFERTWEDGRRLFGDRYVLLRNEELRADPVGAIGRLYAAGGRSIPEPVAAWARGAVKAPEEPFAADDPRWADAFVKLELEGVLRDAGYDELAERTAAASSTAGGGVKARARRLLGR